MPDTPLKALAEEKMYHRRAFDALGRPAHFIDPVVGRFVTNVAFRGHTLHRTESETGSILVAELPYAGKAMLG